MKNMEASTTSPPPLVTCTDDDIVTTTISNVPNKGNTSHVMSADDDMDMMSFSEQAQRERPIQQSIVPAQPMYPQNIINNRQWSSDEEYYWVVALSNNAIPPTRKWGPYICFLGAYPKTCKDEAVRHGKAISDATGISVMICTVNTPFCIPNSVHRTNKDLLTKQERIIKRSKILMDDRNTFNENRAKFNQNMGMKIPTERPEPSDAMISYQMSTNTIMDFRRQKKELAKVTPVKLPTIPRQFEVRRQQYAVYGILNDDKIPASINDDGENLIVPFRCFSNEAEAGAYIEHVLSSKYPHLGFGIDEMYTFTVSEHGSSNNKLLQCDPLVRSVEDPSKIKVPESVYTITPKVMERAHKMGLNKEQVESLVANATELPTKSVVV